MSILVCGSLAFDTIMVFPEPFKNHILPDKIHSLNVCFQVPQIRREFGGTAGNIAYNLKLLGEAGLPMATVGQDFGRGLVLVADVEGTRLGARKGRGRAVEVGRTAPPLGGDDHPAANDGVLTQLWHSSPF